VTVVDPRGPGYATVYPCGDSVPTASNLNYTKGRTVATAAVVPLRDGHVCVYTNTTADIIVDAGGTIAAAGDGSFTGLPQPVRLVDTRADHPTIDGQMSGAGRLAGNTPLRVHVGGRGGLPASPASVVLTVTVVDPVAAGYATVYACGQDPPTASNVNFVSGQTVAANAISVLSGGSVCVVTNVPADVVVDAAGSFG
jgi:hypothetical protein